MTSFTKALLVASEEVLEGSDISQEVFWHYNSHLSIENQEPTAENMVFFTAYVENKP